MSTQKKKHAIAVFLAAALAAQSLPMPVLAASQQTAAEMENEIAPEIEAGTVSGEAAQNISRESAQKEASGVNVAYHTQDEIRDYIESSGAGIKDAVTFQKNPVTEAPYDLGSLSENTLDSALRMLNQIRYIAGISDDVTLDDSYNQLTQAASLVNYANGKMTHYPEQPEGMSDEMYELGRTGAGSSNIAWGSSGGGWTLNYFIAMSWMKDGDASNIARVGHRRWLLNPSMKKTGFGFVEGEKGAHTAVYAFDRSGQANEYGVMWPAQNMPTDYFNGVFPWSISMGTTVDASAVHVTLTRKSDNKVWEFSEALGSTDFYVNNDNYGQIGCIIFRPDGVTSYADGDSYDVEISGLSGGDVSYTVNFFDLARKGAVESVSVSPNAVEVAAGNTQQFQETVTVKDGASQAVTWTVSGNKSKDTSISQTGLLSVAEGEEAATLTVRATSKVNAEKYGEATVTVVPKTPGSGTGGTEPENPGSGTGGTGTDKPGSGTPGTGTTNPGSGTGGTEPDKPGSGTPGTGTTNPGSGTGGTEPDKPGSGSAGTEAEDPGSEETPGTEPEKPSQEPGKTIPKKGKTYTVGNFKYKVTKSAAKNGTVTVTAPKKKTYRSISIPASVKINGYTFKVTAIADKAFKNNKKLKQVSIGSNVTSIGASAFEGNQQLTSVTIGKAITKIGSKAFRGDAKLATIKINGKNLKTVKSGAFQGIAKKAKVRVPKGKAKAYKKLLKKGGLPAKASVK